MANVSKMTSNELEEILAQAKNELARRDKIVIACSEIKKVLEKYNLRAEDIDWLQLNKSTKASNRKNTISKSKSVNKAKVKKGSKQDQRSSVVPKYLNPIGKERWTGRGRAPSWVLNICKQENIDIENFKQDPRFKL